MAVQQVGDSFGRQPTPVPTLAGRLPCLPKAMEAQEAERLARGLIRATERSFRNHLGTRAQNREFIGELYLSLRRTLSQYEAVGNQRGMETRGIADELALTAYLVAVSRYSDVPVGPALLESLRRAIDETLMGWGGSRMTPET
jgi:hypothetical protein